MFRTGGRKRTRTRSLEFWGYDWVLAVIPRLNLAGGVAYGGVWTAIHHP